MIGGNEYILASTPISQSQLPSQTKITFSPTSSEVKVNFKYGTSAWTWHGHSICITKPVMVSETYYVDVCDSVGDKYRFGFNTQEKVNEIAGVGNHYTAEFWEYDTRLGRRWNLDPVDQVSISNYAAFANNPIWLNDIKGDNPIDPRTGKPMKLNLNRASVFWYADKNKIRSVKDEDLYELASPLIKRSRGDHSGTWADGAYVNKHETNFQHTSFGAFETLKCLMVHTGKDNDRDIRITGNAPLDWVWREAADVGTYDFLDDRYAESEVWKINQLEYNIISVKENYITRIIHLDRPDDKSEFNISSVTSFDIQKSDIKSRTVRKWGIEKTEKYRILTVTETTTKYKNNKATGTTHTKKYTQTEIVK